MLKGQDCVVLMKLLANPERSTWTQRELSKELCISLSEINAALKRLSSAGLIHSGFAQNEITPIRRAALEFLVHGIKYCFPVQLTEFSRGMPTGIAAPVFKNKLFMGDEPLPVWQYSEGKVKGLALKPLYKKVPYALAKYPDQNLYDLLALVDIIRIGRARERKIAIEMLSKKLME